MLLRSHEMHSTCGIPYSRLESIDDCMHRPIIHNIIGNMVWCARPMFMPSAKKTISFPHTVSFAVYKLQMHLFRATATTAVVATYRNANANNKIIGILPFNDYKCSVIINLRGKVLKTILYYIRT